MWVCAGFYIGFSVLEGGGGGGGGGGIQSSVLMSRDI